MRRRAAAAVVGLISVIGVASNGTDASRRATRLTAAATPAITTTTAQSVAQAPVGSSPTAVRSFNSLPESLAAVSAVGLHQQQQAGAGQAQQQDAAGQQQQQAADGQQQQNAAGVQQQSISADGRLQQQQSNGSGQQQQQSGLIDVTPTVLPTATTTAPSVSTTFPLGTTTTTTAGPSSTTTTTTAGATTTTQPGTTTTTVGLAGQCTATVSNPTPPGGGNETVTVHSSIPNAPVTVTAHFRTTNSTHSGVTDAAGVAVITFGIGRPTLGFTVVVDVDVAAGRERCQTSFTPQ